ncbi:phage holin family protein [Patiriisocius hiemis]|uniref:Phage holin family protein n=1 Tax=Patiriisocius hiemis TaxID=3075604 RepID=A0ABU2YBM3_9FLAO|nr:phage holin family protein [Constantimarinum sp. W242]MDT0555593.1 phage holin family protein [Constantimarinum sp. W242]
MALDELSENVTSVSDKAKEYSKSMAEYYRLRLFKYVAKSTSSFVLFFSILCLITLGLLFLSFAASFYIGELLDSRALGFLIIGGFYLLILAFVFFFGKKTIERNVLKAFSKLFTEEN